MAKAKYSQIMNRDLLIELLVANKVSLADASQSLGVPYESLLFQARNLLTEEEWRQVGANPAGKTDTRQIKETRDDLTTKPIECTKVNRAALDGLAPLDAAVLGLLVKSGSTGMKAKELATNLGLEKGVVNSILYSELERRTLAKRDEEYRWRATASTFKRGVDDDGHDARRAL